MKVFGLLEPHESSIKITITDKDGLEKTQIWKFGDEISEELLQHYSVNSVNRV